MTKVCARVVAEYAVRRSIITPADSTETEIAASPRSGHTCAMTFRAILFSTFGLAALGIIYLVARKPAKFVDLGAVSANWLAEHRTGPNE